MLCPPGYLTRASYKRVRAHKGSITGAQTLETMMKRGIVIVGSPDTVRERILACHHRLGFANFIALLHFATLPADATARNIRLFASEVMPALQAADDARYRGFVRTRSAVG